MATAVVYKPISPVGDYESVANVKTSEPLTFQYGQDIAKFAVLLPFTLNHIQTYSFLNLFDADATTFVQLSMGAPSAAATTTMIFNFGALVRIRGAFLSFSMQEGGSVAAASTVNFYNSSDGVVWNLLGTKSQTGIVGEEYADFLTSQMDVQFFKIEYYTGGGGAANYTAKFIQLSCLV